jgi:hypothetical protein
MSCAHVSRLILFLSLFQTQTHPLFLPAVGINMIGVVDGMRIAVNHMKVVHLHYLTCLVYGFGFRV